VRLCGKEKKRKGIDASSSCKAFVVSPLGTQDDTTYNYVIAAAGEKLRWSSARPALTHMYCTAAIPPHRFAFSAVAVQCGAYGGQ